MTEDKHSFHMIGIAGVGMSGMAKILVTQGHTVTGSDLQENAVTQDLASHGISLTIGHEASNVPAGAEFVVLSSAIPPDNPEYQEAVKRNLKLLKRGELLALMVNPLKAIGVAGSHGKTTTTAMIYHILEACGVNPGLMVGGQMQETGLNAKAAEAEYFVTEADESDASFLKIFPYVAVVTNIENDHLDHYGSFDRLVKAFGEYIAQVRPDGFAVLWDQDANLTALAKDTATRVVWYGESTAGYTYRDWNVHSGGSSFAVYQQAHCLGEAFLPVPGKHNVFNALAAVAAAVELGCDPARAVKALASFRGTNRRFHYVGEKAGVVIVDDYAHHPTELRATLAAARQIHAGRLIGLFQPHRYSRTKLLAHEFGGSFHDADLVILTDIYSAGEEAEAGVSGELIYQKALQTGVNIKYIPDKSAAARYILEILQPGDMVLTLGAGDIWKTGRMILENL